MYGPNGTVVLETILHRAAHCLPSGSVSTEAAENWSYQPQPSDCIFGAKAAKSALKLKLEARKENLHARTSLIWWRRGPQDPAPLFIAPTRVTAARACYEDGR